MHLPALIHLNPSSHLCLSEMNIFLMTEWKRRILAEHVLLAPSYCYCAPWAKCSMWLLAPLGTESNRQLHLCVLNNGYNGYNPQFFGANLSIMQKENSY